MTQAAFHYEITKEALLCAKHVFVEKPFTLSLAEAEELITLSFELEKNKRTAVIKSNTGGYQSDFLKNSHSIIKETKELIFPL